MIFGKGNNRKAGEIAAAKIESSEFPTLIGTDMCVSGNISGSGELQVDGIVEGNIKAKHVVIGVKAKVTGNIHAESIFIAGNVVGTVDANSIEATRSAKVKGDLVHTELTIETGAIIEGRCKPKTLSSSRNNESKSQDTIE